MLVNAKRIDIDKTGGDSRRLARREGLFAAHLKAGKIWGKFQKPVLRSEFMGFRFQLPLGCEGRVSPKALIVRIADIRQKKAKAWFFGKIF